MFDFDKMPDRSSTHSFKWERYKGKDIIPTWVADTEFSSPQSIIDGLVKRSQHGLFGYTLPNEYTPAIDAVVTWCKQQYDWNISPDWIVWTPGVVPAFNMASKAFTKDREGIIVQTPNYPPLLAAPRINQRERFDVPTILVNERWTLDFEALEVHAADPKTSLFIMCNPMNPVGTVLTEDELTRIAEICNKHDVLLCSDEIHCDLILDDVAHIPAGKHPRLVDNSITLMAASKTFNVAGLGTSFAIIPNSVQRRKFVSAGAGLVPWVTVMGLVATEIAFTKCNAWLDAQLDYLRGNRDYLVNAINNIEGLSCYAPEATFLLWVDASGLNVSDTQTWAEEKGVGPSPGRDFGNPSFFRINYGCPRSMLEEIVSRLSR